MKGLEEECVLISTHFPSYEEFQALFETSVRKIYYMGDVNDEKAVRFLNAHSKASEEGFEIIKLNI